MAGIFFKLITILRWSTDNTEFPFRMQIYQFKWKYLLLIMVGRVTNRQRHKRRNHYRQSMKVKAGKKAFVSLFFELHYIRASRTD